MKKLLLLSSMFLPVLLGQAKPLTPQAALSRAANLSGHHSRIASEVQPSPLLTVMTPSGDAGVYVFADNNEGYLIVSADDCAAPVLGYSDSGIIDINSMPPQLKGWLDFYAKEIQWGSSKGISYTTTRRAAAANKEYIAPLLTCKWDQGAPYNDKCPLDNGKRSVTGCVATAMAQAMYFHQWPAKGTGSHSYTWNGQTLSVDFGNTTYDWTTMTPTYDSSSSDAAKAAVATLMYSCGVSVDMNYSSDESGASSMSMVSSLYKYFNYDKSMTYPQRSYYGTEDWENMVYDQLSQGRPVLYDGQSNAGGHQFICDGYNTDGYFHFNWGWSGMSDGYYLLDALNPLEQGIGGSGSDSGFNYDQGIVLNMIPAQSESSVSPLIYCYGNFSTKATGDVTVGSAIDFDGDYYNFGCSDVKGHLGVKLTASDGTVTYLKHSQEYSFGAFSGYAGFTVTLPDDLANGSYSVSPAFLPEGATEWMEVLCPLSGVQSLLMTVSDGEASFSTDVAGNVTISDFSLNTPIYFDEDFSSSFTVTNSGTTEYFGELVMYLVDSDGDAIAASDNISSIDLLPGESTDLTYIAKFSQTVSTDEGSYTIPSGEYYLAIVTHFTKNVLYVDSDAVTIQNAPAQTSLEVTSLTVNNGGEVTGNKVKFSGTVECTEGYFAGRLKVAVFKKGATETNLAADTDYVFISEGESQNFTATVDLSSEGDETEFFAIVYQDSREISNEYPFSLSTLGINKMEGCSDIGLSYTADMVSASSQYGLENIFIYAADGSLVGDYSGGGATEVSVPVGDLSHGIYIISIRDLSGATATINILR